MGWTEKLSVIVPVYRVEQWLGQCVESILDQSFRDFRLYLIDDGSPDGCPALCDAFARRDSRVSVVHQPNRGVSAARNAGLSLAGGRYITFCDGDDFWHRDHLAVMLRAAEESGAEMVSCNYRRVDASGAALDRSAYPAHCRALETEADRENYMLEDVLGGRTGWAVWARLFSAELLHRGNIRFCESCGGFGEDLNFVLQCCLHARRVQGIDWAGCHYRRRPGSAMTGTENRLDRLNESAFHFCGCFRRVLPRSRRFPELWLGMLRSGFAGLPTARIPGEIQRLHRRDWFFDQLERYLALPGPGPQTRAFLRFCRHGRLWRYRLERRLGRLRRT